MHDRLLAGFRAFALTLWTLSLLPPALLVWRLRPHYCVRVARLWCRGCCAIVGLEIKRIGQPAAVAS